MKRILLPTDFSRNSWNAIRYAQSLFRGHACEFFLLNAFQVGSSGLVTTMGRTHETRLYRSLKKESERGLANILALMSKSDENQDHRIKTYSMAAHLVQAVATVVKSKDIDLIIMGTKGASGLKEVFLGSNAHKIIKEIHACPIILVPDEFELYGSFEAMVLATGYEHLFHAQELKPIIEISNNFGAKVLVTHAGEASALTSHQEGVRKHLAQQLNTVKHEFVFLKKESSVNETIQKMIGERGNIHMVAMVNYWHSFFEKLTQEPVIKKVAFNTTVPFLVVHLFE
ncbi:universal stress protein [Flagellimonas meishanensis]|uniref:universal stress protein n=1 Tax=Flagellimonas meishanensis TaxID=2873264 RepID=UPI001CA6833B|nr:universal stress protein [[Muricauda] meishanensis]